MQESRNNCFVWTKYTFFDPKTPLRVFAFDDFNLINCPRFFYENICNASREKKQFKLAFLKMVIEHFAKLVS